jgi:hypothetical protein
MSNQNERQKYWATLKGTRDIKTFHEYPADTLNDVNVTVERAIHSRNITDIVVQVGKAERNGTVCLVVKSPASPHDHATGSGREHGDHDHWDAIWHCTNVKSVVPTGGPGNERPTRADQNVSVGFDALGRSTEFAHPKNPSLKRVPFFDLVSGSNRGHMLNVADSLGNKIVVMALSWADFTNGRLNPLVFNEIAGTYFRNTEQLILVGPYSLSDDQVAALSSINFRPAFVDQ